MCENWPASPCWLSSSIIIFFVNLCSLCLPGVVPSCVMEALKATGVTDTPSPAGGAVFSKRTGLSVYRSLRRQRRRSVGGEIFLI